MSVNLGSAMYVVGLKQSIKALNGGKAKKIFLASDADFYISEKVSDACTTCGVDIEVSLTMEELGKLCKIDVGAAVVAILK